MKGLLWEKDLVAVYRLDQKSQRKQEENDPGNMATERKGKRHRKEETNASNGSTHQEAKRGYSLQVPG